MDHLLPGSNRHAKHASRVPQSLAAEVQLSPLPYCETGPTAATGGAPAMPPVSGTTSVSRIAPGAPACTWRRGQERIGPHSLQRDRREGKTDEEG